MWLLPKEPGSPGVVVPVVALFRNGEVSDDPLGASRRSTRYQGNLAGRLLMDGDGSRQASHLPSACMVGACSGGLRFHAFR